jgi:hypothetical protein
VTRIEVLGLDLPWCTLHDLLGGQHTVHDHAPDDTGARNA